MREDILPSVEIDEKEKDEREKKRKEKIDGLTEYFCKLSPTSSVHIESRSPAFGRKRSRRKTSKKEKKHKHARILMIILVK